MNTLIKICGITELDDLNCAIEHGADLIGFVFVQSSPRYIEPKSATHLVLEASRKVNTVAVMQHPTQDDLDSVLEYFKPTYIQSDADDFESIKFPNEIKKIKVYRTEKSLDISTIDNQSFSLLEGPTSGSGQMANKEILKKACKSNKLFIAGGLSPDNISSFLETVNPFGVDVSSGVESTRGIKSREKIIQFNKIVHAFNESKL